ncbi:F-box protein, putative [Phytophthora infestans T30-4]|uniref:F-box protein, putative n=3 Tax=Phytophthora infestans TaxID=4787 RepID=D0NA64_PHYIT|nr:F-box protein, putative [Phytophthora infestans T30-4]EEY54318.1 F-box protein, putative [Phytophthora infestans T30-4]KAF4148996.1 F-box domain [Phytophthora infestans]|eukprot:XP_002904140.1 F-box protein, putative [Phytophthora infestans T30-4]
MFHRNGACGDRLIHTWNSSDLMAPHRQDVATVKGSAHRDADEEALQAALQESLEPDFMAEILQSESQQRRQVHGRTRLGQLNFGTSSSDQKPEENQQEVDSGDDDEHGVDTGRYTRLSISEATEKPPESVDVDEEEEEDEDPNEDHTLLNFADILLIDILKWLDEDTIGACTCTCKRLLQVARSEVLFEALCRRIFPVQNPRAAAAAARNKFGLRRFPTWFDMFQDRPRVRYNGFYWLKVSYYKKPELSMWSEIVPGTILKCIYYRYFSFQRDGTVLYGMLFKAPHEVESHIRSQRKGVYSGRFYVDKDELVVTVPTNCNEVNFRLKITQRERGKNVKLVLKEHFANSEPDGSGWVSYYDTADEEFYYYRSWNL